MIQRYDKFIKYFQNHLIKREVEFAIHINKEDNFLLTKVGLPDKILGFDFTNKIKIINDNEISIGNYNSNEIILNIKNRSIYLDIDYYLAKNLNNFLNQLYVYDLLWNCYIPNEELGKYRENNNHKRYALFLKNNLLEIDSSLLQDDTSYFWGALIEDMEFGIVG